MTAILYIREITQPTQHSAKTTQGTQPAACSPKGQRSTRAKTWIRRDGEIFLKDRRTWKDCGKVTVYCFVLSSYDECM